jgi:SSS family solute:Na+ symporter
MTMIATIARLYMAAMVFLGWRAARGSKSLNDYFDGGRNVGGFAAGISLLATLLSTISYLALPGEVISHGTGFLWQVLIFPVVFFVVGYLLIPHIMALPVNSAYELLETRLGPGIRTLGACVFIALRLFWMALILHTACDAMAVVTGVRREWLILAMAAVTLIYTTEGGIRAVIWTDVTQFFILLGGAVFTYAYLANATELSAGRLLEEAWNRAVIPVFSFDPQVRMSVIGLLISVGLWWIATCGSDQVAMQRFFTNRDARVARRTLLINLIASTVTFLALAAVGVALLSYVTADPGRLPAEYQDLKAQGDKIFPHFISHGLPTGLCGLVIAALFAAAMSSLSSGLNSITTVLTVDFFRRRNPVATDRQERRRAQMTTVLSGCVAVALSLLLPLIGGNFFELASRVLDPFTGPLFGLFALAFFDRKATGKSAAIGFVVGLATAFFIVYGHHLLRLDKPFSFLLIAPGSILATIVVGMIAARCRQRVAVIARTR